jgi:hypothetical protein
MTNVIRFPSGQSLPPPAPASSLDALVAELTAVEIKIARARLLSARYENAAWLWRTCKRTLFWGCVLWLMATFVGGAHAANTPALDMRVTTLKTERDDYAGGSIYALLAVDSDQAYVLVDISCVVTFKGAPVFERQDSIREVINGRTIKRVTFQYKGPMDNIECRAINATGRR